MRIEFHRHHPCLPLRSFETFEEARTCLRICIPPNAVTYIQSAIARPMLIRFKNVFLSTLLKERRTLRICLTTLGFPLSFVFSDFYFCRSRCSWYQAFTNAISSALGKRAQPVFLMSRAHRWIHRAIVARTINTETKISVQGIAQHPRFGVISRNLMNPWISPLPAVFGSRC